jgi:hypothetical protein
VQLYAHLASVHADYGVSDAAAAEVAVMAMPPEVAQRLLSVVAQVRDLRRRTVETLAALNAIADVPPHPGGHEPDAEAVQTPQDP